MLLPYLLNSMVLDMKSALFQVVIHLCIMYCFSNCFKVLVFFIFCVQELDLGMSRCAILYIYSFLGLLNFFILEMYGFYFVLFYQIC